MTKIKFPAGNATKVGDLVRYCHPAAKFWRVVKIVGGVAVAKPAGFGTDPRVACC